MHILCIPPGAMWVLPTLLPCGIIPLDHIIEAARPPCAPRVSSRQFCRVRGRVDAQATGVPIRLGRQVSPK